MNHVDWNDKQSVVDYARRLHCQTTMVVVKHPDRANYNICHESRKDTYQPDWVVCRIKPHEAHHG